MACQSNAYDPTVHDAHIHTSLAVSTHVPVEGIPELKGWIYPWPVGAEIQRFTGGCHCRKFRFEIAHPKFGENSDDGDSQYVVQCNCSICATHGKLNIYVPSSSAYFRFLNPSDGNNSGFSDPDLGSHMFNKRVIHHRFCRVCGTHVFAHADASLAQEIKVVGINIRTLDGFDLAKIVNIKESDGRSY